MPRPFIPLNIRDFAALLKNFTPTRPINTVHVHHTWRPNHSQDRGLPTIEAMYNYHVNERGFSDIAQHITIDSRGTIWTGRSWNRIPASATGYNTGAFMFEMIGDFDIGNDPFIGQQSQNAYMVTAFLLQKFNLPITAIRFHREFADKTCPGTSLNLEGFRHAVAERLQVLESQETPPTLEPAESSEPIPANFDINMRPLSIEPMSANVDDTIDQSRILALLILTAGDNRNYTVNELEADCDCNSVAFERHIDALQF